MVSMKLLLGSRSAGCERRNPPHVYLLMSGTLLLPRHTPKDFDPSQSQQHNVVTDRSCEQWKQRGASVSCFFSTFSKETLTDGHDRVCD